MDNADADRLTEAVTEDAEAWRAAPLDALRRLIRVGAEPAIEGARMLGMEDRIGSLAPGKQADLVSINADALNMQPVHDPMAAVVMQANVANIDCVMVAGQWKKRRGRLLAEGIEEKLERIRQSGRSSRVATERLNRSRRALFRCNHFCQ